jgi:fluoride exporter
MGMIFSIAAGGALGALGRYFLSNQIMALAGAAFPWAILLVNVAGCFAMGVIAELAALNWNLSPAMKAFLATGILGGFTTFSAFALDTAVLTERGELGNAMLYVAGSVGGSIAALFLGLFLVRSFAQ